MRRRYGQVSFSSFEEAIHFVYHVYIRKDLTITPLFVTQGCWYLWWNASYKWFFKWVGQVSRCRTMDIVFVIITRHHHHHCKLLTTSNIQNSNSSVETQCIICIKHSQTPSLRDSQAEGPMLRFHSSPRYNNYVKWWYQLSNQQAHLKLLCHRFWLQSSYQI